MDAPALAASAMEALAAPAPGPDPVRRGVDLEFDPAVVLARMVYISAPASELYDFLYRNLFESLERESCVLFRLTMYARCTKKNFGRYHVSEPPVEHLRDSLYKTERDVMKTLKQEYSNSEAPS
ncbi:hypothetical protein Zm00014a_033323 [Zea mays]|uniref:Uncharacterized protein n=1 Tax=Zea mays TaxID=4577 RepID=A0A3L6FGL5_MAIZE|nr:hypothetical protein Zm00014a_033323 [Zea mays]